MLARLRKRPTGIRPHRRGDLRGWLHGHGDYSRCSYIEQHAVWLVVEVANDDIIELDGICKFPRGKVLFVGDSKAATDFLFANDPRSRELPVIGAHRTVGKGGTAVVGALGMAKAGEKGSAQAGYRGIAMAGDGGTAVTGFRGNSAVGSYGTAITGQGGHAVAGDHGVAIAGLKGTASAGAKGQINIWYWDFVEQRYRMAVGCIGEVGLDPYTLYTLDEYRHFIKV